MTPGFLRIGRPRMAAAFVLFLAASAGSLQAAEPAPGADGLIDTPAKAAAAQKACAEKIGRPVEWTNEVGMKFRLVPPGTFIMGVAKDAANPKGDAPPHKVTLTQPYYMGETEVTRAQWEKVTGRVHSTYFPGPDQPINDIAYDTADRFIRGLAAAGAKGRYRLPTEAEWEFAARGGETGDFPGGDNPAGLDKAAWYLANADDTTHPVATKAPNAFGLYDMLGNVWEWCSDYYDPNYYRASPQADPKGPALSLTGYGYRVLRGGSIYYGPTACRFGNRGFFQDSRYEKHIGFRVMLPITEGPIQPAPAK